MDNLEQLEIIDLAFDGRAVAHNPQGKVVFLQGGLPGEIVQAEIINRKRRYDVGIVREITTKSPARIEARCSHFGLCGGCTWQDLDYAEQLAFKRRQVVACLERLAKLKEVVVHPVLGCDNPFFYRNKMEFSFQALASGAFTLGLHPRGHFDRTFDLAECWLQSDLSNRIVAWMRTWATDHGITAYDLLQHDGYFRFLIIRQTVHTRQLMVNIVTNRGPFPGREQFISDLTASFPEITTLVHNESSRLSGTATGEVETVLTGPGYIEEELLGQRFRIHANSFFQTNSLQAERLYGTGFAMLDARPHERLLDLYCGAGTIGILLARSVGSVVGVELGSQAVEAARVNAQLNGLDNVSFRCADVTAFLADPAAAGFDAVVVDPPRAGMHPRALKRLLKLVPPKLLYISCNPATFARDAALLIGAGYGLGEVRPVDMFPHTMHIEIVGLFARR